MNISGEDRKIFYSLSRELGVWIDEKERKQGINIIIILIAFMYVVKLFTQQLVTNKICTVKELQEAAKRLDEVMNKGGTGRRNELR